MQRLIPAVLPLFLLSICPAQGTPIGFEETWALATDRGKALEQLIPGTPTHFYYSCRYHQDRGALREAATVLDRFRRRHGRNGQVRELEARQALLDFDADPAAGYEFVRRSLGLRFDHQRQQVAAERDLASALDGELVSAAAYARRARLRNSSSAGGFSGAALWALLDEDLSLDLLRDVLRRLPRADHPRLPELVVRELNDRRSRGFGSLSIHNQLTLAQLEACAQQRPELLLSRKFVRTWLQRLRPGADRADLRDPQVRLAYLERLESFSSRLAHNHNSLKAQVLYHRLRHDFAAGRIDQERLLRYLRLPRRASYVNPEWIRRLQRGSGLTFVDFRRDQGIALPAIGTEAAFLRELFLSHFKGLDDFTVFQPFLQERYLKRLFAEAKILAGVGDMDRWYQLLDDPGYYEQLKQRVEIQFAPGQRTVFGAEDAVRLDLDIKHVPRLIVKVFEINAFNYYRQRGRELSTSIQLDGLVANHRRQLDYQEPALRRVRRSFDFPQCSKPGVYVIEFIGNGISSRALVRKGSLRLTSRTGVAGQVVTVRDETGAPVAEAEAWLGTRRFVADAQGQFVLPFSTKPGQRKLVLRKGRVCALAPFTHEGESYRLQAGVHVVRESLLARREARVVIRPQLILNGRRVPLQVLEEPVLEVFATDREGTEIRRNVEGLEFGSKGETVHLLQVPAGLRSLRLSLRGKVQQISKNEPLTLRSAARSFELNRIDASRQTDCPLLSRNSGGYVIDVLGKNGEPRVGRSLRLSFWHEGFRDSHSVTLKTDARGRVELGPLPGIQRLQCSGLPRGSSTWQLQGGSASLPGTLHGLAGETLQIPYAAKTLARDAVSLFELRGGMPARDAFDSLAVAAGYLRLQELQPGDYELRLKRQGHTIRVRITAGAERSGYLVGQERSLQRGRRSHLQILRLSEDAQGLAIELAGRRDDTRVHVMVSRYLPPFRAYGNLQVGDPDPVAASGHSAAYSAFESGRVIGDELRYILERRFAQKFPGNMLERPSLLLNPWRLEDVPWDTSMEGAQGKGGAYRGEPSESNRWNEAQGLAGGAGGKAGGLAPSAFANLEFMAEPGVLITNLRPDAAGKLRIPGAQLGRGSIVTVFAADARASVSRKLYRDEQPLQVQSQALAKALDAEQNRTEQRKLEFLQKGGKAVLDGAGSTQAELYDSLAAVHALFVSLSGNQDLARFGFLLGWPGYEAKRKAELYEQYACHELHVFLHEKDPEFFAAVVKPYLRNKRDKTFMDHWLLGDDLRGYLEPWAFDQLNVVEQILLARRLDDGGTRRHVREGYEILPRDPQRLARLFGAVLKARSLDDDEADSLGKKLNGLRDRAARKVSKNKGRGGQYRGPGDALPRSPAPTGPSTPGPGRPAGPATGAARAKPKADAGRPAQRGAPAEQANAADDAKAEFARELRDLEQRQEVRRLYRALGKTRPQVEHNYWHVRQGAAGPDLIKVNAFWRDFAFAPAGQPFVSVHLPEAGNSFAEMILAMAFLDLPFQAGAHETRLEERSLTLQAASPLLLARREVVAVDPAAAGSPVLVNQNYYRLDEPYRMVGNQRVDAYVDEFVIGVAYGCRVVVTNSSSTPRELDLLLQIPAGAIPVQNGFFTSSRQVQLGAYATQAIEYAFYFPKDGNQAHYPVQVAQEGRLVAAAEARNLRVLQVESKVDTESWRYISQFGSEEQVLQHLDQNNLKRIDLAMIAWRLRDKDFFRAVITRLRARRHYHDLSWSYGVWHKERGVLKEFLPYQNTIVALCGTEFASPVFDVDPIRRRTHEFMEFIPLVNARAHRFGKQHRIMDQNVAKQYLAVLRRLGAKKQLDDADRLTACYYLLLQDRVEEALELFGRIDPGRLVTRLQYDYLRAYLDMFEGDLAVAREIAARHKDHPVLRWRKLFAGLQAQLAEIDGAAVATVDPKSREQELAAAAAKAPVLELAVDGQEVAVQYRNLASCQLRYYEMDVEFLFSTQPFVQQGAGSFAFIKPNLEESRSLAKDKSELRFAVPERFAGRNVLIEIEGGGVIRRVPCYARSMKVQWFENQGQLRIRAEDGSKPISTVYVKVYARLADGRVRFFKDGYTDLRGRFDYASLSAKEAAGVRRFAVLVLSEQHGAMVRELAPPTQ